MLYNILYEQTGLINIVKYLTFRTGGAILTSLLISFLFGPKIIKWLKSKQKQGNKQKEYYVLSEEKLLKKQSTPIMGGILILISIFVSTLLWADLKNPYIWIAVFVTSGFGIVGFIDDYQKLTKKNAAGISGKLRLLIEILITFTAVFAITQISPIDFKNSITFPFVKNFIADIGIFYFIFTIIVIVGSANAVNLTDGLDGLAIFPTMVTVGIFLAISYIVGRIDFAEYLFLPHIPGSGELTIFCGAMIGSALGFLWYNAPPAKVFMGDTGSLALGSALGIVAVITKHEFVLAIAGGLFVLEAVSVILQVLSFKLTGKRIFKMAPIHHHFQKIGWEDSTIVIRFWIISLILALFSLSTLKLR